MAPSKKRLAKGAIGKCLARLSYPKPVLRKALPNLNHNKEFKNAIVVDIEKKKIKKSDVECVVFNTDEVMNEDVHVDLYVPKRYFHVHTDGPETNIVVTEAPVVEQPNINDVEAEESDVLPEEVTEAMARSNIDDQTIENIGTIVTVDDDNQPLPENIPSPNDSTNRQCVMADNWGFLGTCPRKMNNITDATPTINNPPINHPNLVDLFEIFFPKQYLISVLLPQINNIRQTSEEVKYGEFLRFIGIWFLMATSHSSERSHYWRDSVVDCFKGAPYRFGAFMSRNRFDDILSSLVYTNQEVPSYRDKFFQIRQMVMAWNDNMHQSFSPGWITCLDESMMVWTNQFSCPGFMFVPRKPHPFGNEWHTICCGVSGIMFAIELVEGKDAPPERGAPMFDEFGKTVGLLLRLTQSIWYSGKVIILDSGFCVLKGLIELKKKGLYASALIKKRRYWPKHVKGDDVKEHFADKAVGEADAWYGIFENHPWHLFAMKEPTYCMMLMSTYGTLERMGKMNYRNFVGNAPQHSFQYPEVVANHYKYRHIVDDHNARRHSPISLEETWATKRWANRVFAFLLSITEINIMLAATFFYGKKKTATLDFRKEFSKELIYNKYVTQEQREEQESRRRSQRLALNVEHKLLHLPKNKKFCGAKFVTSSINYPQFKCSGCPKRIRTYCQCTRGVYLCKECYARHVASSQSTTDTP